MTQRLEDRAAIQDLNSRYATMCDTFQLEATLDCWTDDAVFDERESGYGEIRGKEALRAFFRDTIFATNAFMVHMMSNHLIDFVDADRATGSVWLIAESVKKSGVRSRVIARYEDEYRRTEQGWKFQLRSIRIGPGREIVPPENWSPHG